ncbi:Rv3235 family protein [Specibacter sp. NPDC057265]|uniref:Rv3235 family protein n=1 Tax=Specibacter sp. NPDC057265 TaxID=3346075 RepID=UPI0036373B11
MNTAAVSGDTAPPLLVVTRAPQTGSPPAVDNRQPAEPGLAANVVQLPDRERQPDQPGRTNATVDALNPQAAERTVVCAMSCKVAQASLEVLSGVRSVQQLSRWLSSKSMDALTARARLHAEAARSELRRRSQDQQNVHPLYHQAVIHSVHCSAVAPGIYEASVVVADKTRFRAIAMRLERSRGLWKVTALQIG